jgi:hypothetical protein
MKISMGGRYNPHEFVDAIERIVQSFTANGVDEFRTITLYLNAYGEERRILLRDEHSGRYVEHFHYDGPRERIYRSITPRLQIIDDEEDASS